MSSFDDSYATSDLLARTCQVKALSYATSDLLARTCQVKALYLPGASDSAQAAMSANRNFPKDLRYEAAELTEGIAATAMAKYGDLENPHVVDILMSKILSGEMTGGRAEAQAWLCHRQEIPEKVARALSSSGPSPELFTALSKTVGHRAMTRTDLRNGAPPSSFIHEGAVRLSPEMDFAFLSKLYDELGLSSCQIS